MEIIKLKLKDIRPYENNAKLHPHEQVEQIKNSIIRFGNNDPIAVDEDNVIIEGHGRYEALKELGYEEAEVIVLTGLSEDEKSAYRIVHNQLTMNTDWDMSMLKDELSKISIDMKGLGLDEALLDQIEDEHAEAKEDDFNVSEALDEIEEPMSKLGDIYQLGDHRLMCGDSTSAEDVAKLMDDTVADLVMTDPPYNINVSNSQGMTIENDNLNDTEFSKFLSDAFVNLKNSLKDGGSFYVWFATKTHVAFETALNAAGLNVRQELVWVKNQFVLGRSDYHWKHEPCLYGWKDGDSHYFVNDRTQSNVIDNSIDVDNVPADVLRDYVKKIHECTTVHYANKPLLNDLHPTMKPIPLIGKLIKNSSRQHEIILDLFGGSGSTLIACEQLKRSCYMMEYDPKYADVIIKRWENLTGRKAVKL